MVDVVQLVEHRIVVPSVVGSSPIIHPCEKGSLRRTFFFYAPDPEPPVYQAFTVFYRRKLLR